MLLDIDLMDYLIRIMSQDSIIIIIICELPIKIIFIYLIARKVRETGMYE
jgi:hypothetical protein